MRNGRPACTSVVGGEALFLCPDWFDLTAWVVYFSGSGIGSPTREARRAEERKRKTRNSQPLPSATVIARSN